MGGKWKTWAKKVFTSKDGPRKAHESEQPDTNHKRGQGNLAAISRDHDISPKWFPLLTRVQDEGLRWGGEGVYPWHRYLTVLTVNICTRQAFIRPGLKEFCFYLWALTYWERPMTASDLWPLPFLCYFFHRNNKLNFWVSIYVKKRNENRAGWRNDCWLIELLRPRFISNT